ncbi:MAG: toll/interleukin-1 receptor domain-containing protein, partial [Eggerthellaceae bacterium]|nr:toll/interleukin-1 receptor domain-containing protein [Eggerthellaceae bacterium]
MTWEKRHSDTRQTANEYAAFISYRHLPQDQEVAKQVQHAIETFRLPRGINAPGRTDGHLGKCFRDEDELSASHSLPDRILDALAKSSSLVVICSPEARDSVWVNREIAAFIEMHGRERIFTVLAYGSSAESIPPLLRTETAVPGSAEATAANPLAADLRPTTTKKKRDEMLRIIAAVADCSFDDLRQRGRTRTIKRGITIAVAAALVVAAIAAAL